MTIASIVMPRWVSYSPVSFIFHRSLPLLLLMLLLATLDARVIAPSLISRQNDKREMSMGLHQRCSSVTGKCTPFPQATDCVKDQYFCSMWRTVGFLISFDVVIELCALVSFIVIISGGVQRRSTGWKLICSILLLGGIFQCAAMALVVCLTLKSQISNVAARRA